MPDIDSGHEPIITFKLENSKPVDLLDLTGSLAAFGEAYRDYVARAGYDIEPGNVRLFIREIRTGSVIAALASMADQASWILSHFDAAVGFVSRFDQILHYFLLLPSESHEVPTKRDAAQAIAVMEPVLRTAVQIYFLMSAVTYIFTIMALSMILRKRTRFRIRRAGFLGKMCRRIKFIRIRFYLFSR